ncbi:hypothetical protein DAT35_38030 [Vitiosangium sp. GDMCC 1.1324]|nr:hypothetical protein DAT35_38030 [Vitiosangium sp. GDMCC 1.1324]
MSLLLLCAGAVACYGSAEQLGGGGGNNSAGEDDPAPRPLGTLPPPQQGPHSSYALAKVAEGIDDNWTFLAGELPGGEEVLDFFHATEHLNLALADAYARRHGKRGTASRSSATTCAMRKTASRA